MTMMMTSLQTLQTFNLSDLLILHKCSLFLRNYLKQESDVQWLSVTRSFIGHISTHAMSEWNPGNGRPGKGHRWPKLPARRECGTKNVTLALFHPLRKSGGGNLKTNNPPK